MIPTLFLLGPSDNEAQTATTRERVEGGVKVTMDLTGVLPILPFVTRDPALAANSHTVLVGVHEIELGANARVNLFNLVGDADSSKMLLRRIGVIANRIRPLRYFNKADHVPRTARAQLPITLANIPGCSVPRTEMVQPKTFDALRAACEKFNSWPMIVRARGYHNSEKMLLLHDLSELEAAKDQSWLYGDIFLIEFVDSRNADGLYHKARVVMVDGVPHPRHCLYSEKWAISAGARSGLMHQDLELCHQEERFLADILNPGSKDYRQVFREIHQRIGLDVFGIDFALVDGRMVIFEANPCMKFLDRQYRGDERYHYLDNYVDALKKAIRKMLLTP
ncbi:MAG: hypothetical protein KA137_11785 [Halioglobus sp.]|nr:hypothetical protein [Halioglobus sp.]